MARKEGDTLMDRARKRDGKDDRGMMMTCGEVFL